MELRFYLDILRRRWWILALVPVVVAAIAYILSAQEKPIYKATAVILVNQTGNSGVVQYNDVLASERLTNTYAEIVERRVVLAAVVDQLKLTISEGELNAKVSVSAVSSTQLLRVSVEDPSPALAALIANTLAQVFIEDNATQLGRPGTVSIIDEAIEPSSPVSPDLRFNMALGALLGVMLAVSIVAVQEYLDDTVKTPEDVEAVAGLTTLGVISRFVDADLRAITHPAQAVRSRTSEAFRQVRTNIHFARLARETKTVLFTSSDPGEGKSTIAANVAVVMAEAGDRVILVDTDLRQPSQHSLFGAPNSFGLTGLLLSDDSDLSRGLIKTPVENLWLLPSGPLPPNPSELLTSAKMKTLIGTLSESADYVLFDSPPILAVTDASILASVADGTIVVIEMGEERAETLRRTRGAIEQANAHAMGVVINKVKSSSHDYYYGQGYGVTTETEEQEATGKTAPRRRLRDETR